MRIWKKVMSIVAAVAMAATMMAASGSVAWAAGSHTITIERKGGSQDDHTYSAYQIFAGTYDQSGKKLSNITWGNGVDGEYLLTALKKDSTIGNKFADVTTAEAVANVLTGFSNDSAQIDAFAKVAGQHLKSDAGHSMGQDRKITNLDDGYYLIKDTSKGLGSDTASKFMVQVVGDVSVTEKSETTTSEKKVKEKNDTTGAETGWQDAADYDIGDEVPFQLTGTVANDYDQYSTYYFAFHDKQSAGLDAPQNITVKVGNKVLDSGYQVVTKDLTDGCTFEIQFTDLKSIKDVTIEAGTVITVEYTAKLNDNAVIGSEGNPNKSHIEFSNNPNDETKHGNTPNDTVIVFTYETIVNKVSDEKGEDGKNKPLAGAGFTLYKKVKNTETNEVSNKEVKTIAAGDATKFEFKGLDAGDYVLKETTTPAGYNTISDVEFTIVAEYDTKNANPKFITLMGKSSTDTDLQVDLGTQKATVSPQAGTITTDIVNKSGSLLPSTGGIGAKRVIGAGAVLFAVGMALMFIRKKIAGRN